MQLGAEMPMPGAGAYDRGDRGGADTKYAVGIPAAYHAERYPGLTRWPPLVIAGCTVPALSQWVEHQTVFPCIMRVASSAEMRPSW